MSVWEKLTFVNSTTNFTFCGPQFHQFWNTYFPELVVLQVALVVSLFGIWGNIMNLIIFSRPSMRNSTNVILMGISIADIPPMIITCIYYVTRMDHLVGNQNISEYFSAFLIIVMTFSGSFFHTCLVLITITLAVWRYIGVIHPLKSKSICTVRRARLIMAGIFIINLTICVPVYWNFEIVQWNVGNNSAVLTDESSVCGYEYCTVSELNLIRKIEFIYNGLFCRFVAVIILLFVSVRLIVSLRLSRERRKTMTMSSMSSVGAGSSQFSISSNNTTVSDHKNGSSDSRVCTANRKNTMESDRTTKMLLVVLLLFLITQLPMVAWYLLTVVLGQVIFKECGNIVILHGILLYNLSGGLHFVIYLTMSRKFKHTFLNLFHHPFT